MSQYSLCNLFLWQCVKEHWRSTSGEYWEGVRYTSPLMSQYSLCNLFWRSNEGNTGGSTVVGGGWGCVGGWGGRRYVTPVYCGVGGVLLEGWGRVVEGTLHLSTYVRVLAMQLFWVG